MGYTLKQIDHYYNDVVNLYRSMGFADVPCSNFTYFGNSYRSQDLHKDNETARVSLYCGVVTPKGFNYSVSYIDLVVEKTVDLSHRASEMFMRYYRIDDNYFTTDLQDVRVSRDIALMRYLSFWEHRSMNLHLDFNKMPDNLQRRLFTAVGGRLSENRSSNYKVIDAYFSYVGKERKFVIVIKNDDSVASEAFWFDPIALAHRRA